MLFSVIIPVFNVDQYLRDCLDSVMSQIFNDFEVICINDGSTDESLSILEEYSKKDSRIVIVNQENKGLSGARNMGLKAAKGEYVFFLDSDDWITPDALQILANSISGEDVLCFNGQRYFEETDEYEKPDNLPDKSYISGWIYYNESALLHRNFAFVCVVLRLYKRDFLLKNNLLFYEGIYHEDNLFTPIVCYYAGKLKVISDCLYIYRVRGNSIMTKKSEKHILDILFVANTLAEFFIPKAGIDKTIVYRAVTHHYQVAFVNAEKCKLKEVKSLVDWQLYSLVSRTKLRHRVGYVLLRFCPMMYKCFLS
jgi:Glycosyltransferases involved in cell wall biogenesis